MNPAGLNINKNITALIGRAIREGKYLSITYENKNGEINPFWISILDINAKGELYVNMFNVTKDEPLLNKKIFISGIQTAEILKFSHYPVTEVLLNKIENDTELEIYHFDRFDSNILNYYLDCYKSNQDPFLHKQHLIPGIDLNELIIKKPYLLSEEQQKTIIKDIYHNDYNVYFEYELALSEFSIDLESRGKYVIAYRKLTFDPVERILRIGDKIFFNSSFYIKDNKYTLSYYTDISPADFEASYLNNKSNTIEALRDSFRSGEILNTRPEIVVLGYAQIDISDIYDNISIEHARDELGVPLKAFFQNMSQLYRKNNTKPDIVLYDEQVNIDQMRTIYNALKYPVTYVQGPPGTGKTHTILNIVVNFLINNRTLLITSNNNTPIDGITDKLKLGLYNNKEILLPFIRLGNKRYTLEAMNKIRDLYEFDTKDIPKDKLLRNLKEKTKSKNQNLQKKLEWYEDREELKQYLEFVNALLKKGTNWALEKEQHKILKSLKEIPETTNENVKGEFVVIRDNYSLLQYFYFDSLRYLKRLRGKEFKDLIEIVYQENEEEKVKEFYKWLASDKNLLAFTKVFPVILTTNLSSRRLGRRFKFDLLAMDEAGQCDIATSLIPISKCKNMVLIGDTNQLKPIVIFEESRNQQLMQKYGIEEEYDYFNNSILSAYRQVDNISSDILLSYHYRCGKKIINYSNARYYDNKLNISAVKKVGELKLLNVKNANQKAKNAQLEEASAIVEYIRDNQLTDVFIITPFRNQEEVINHYLEIAKSKGEIADTVRCGTIHKIQGQENNTIILSTAISEKTSPKTYDWIKNNSQLINVAVTRARERLIVVTDLRAIDTLSRKDDDLYALVDYVQKKGTTELSASEANKLTIGKSNNSKFEDEFYKTMQHYCSIKGVRYARNVKVIDVFPEEMNNTLAKGKEFDGVIYEKNEPKVVFELNGKEHYNNPKRIKSDTLKMELFKGKNVKILFVPNQYVKHYEFIRELINKIKGGAYQTELFGYDN
ncbi:MAG: DNA helicase [Bacteroidetes bacterium]|nr:DNA helicase [Bacteroidota bacterium]